MSKNKPKVQFMCWGELRYIECGEEEPAIEEDGVNLTAVIHLSNAFRVNQFTINLFPLIDGAINLGEQVVQTAQNGEYSTDNTSNSLAKTLHFPLQNLQCFTKYYYEIRYKGVPVELKKLHRSEFHLDHWGVINTPPARRDPRPIRFAAGGDQEWHRQLGFLGKVLGLDHHQQTKKIYQHIAEQGDIKAPVDAPIEFQPYSMVIHLGDVFNGEIYFSLKNLFRRDRHLIEPYVSNYKAFKDHINANLMKLAGNSLAQLGYGTYFITDDHDGGHNSLAYPVTAREKKSQEAMQNAFHEAVLLPNFLQQTYDGYGNVMTDGRDGPYYKLRIGMIEFFFLHARYTKKDGADAAGFLLGETQWAWFEQSLEQSKADKKILVSPLPFVMGKNPEEDFRGHWQEWERVMQLCRKYDISQILTADSHNYSYTKIAVREHEDDLPYWVHQQLIGTLGGGAQSITSEEQESIAQAGRPPLLPVHPDFNPERYRDSSVISYFVSNEKTALLPLRSMEDWDEDCVPTDSQWTQEKEWDKGTLGYGSFEVEPMLDEADVEAVKPTQLKWQTRFSFFSCTDKQSEIGEETRLKVTYETEKF